MHYYVKIADPEPEGGRGIFARINFYVAIKLALQRPCAPGGGARPTIRQMSNGQEGNFGQAGLNMDFKQ